MGARSDYDFWVLAVCLAILALQFHNPFQQQQTPCVCPSGGHPATAVKAGAQASLSDDELLSLETINTQQLFGKLDDLKEKHRQQQDELMRARQELAEQQKAAAKSYQYPAQHQQQHQQHQHQQPPQPQNYGYQQQQQQQPTSAPAAPSQQQAADELLAKLTAMKKQAQRGNSLGTQTHHAVNTQPAAPAQAQQPAYQPPAQTRPATPSYQRQQQQQVPQQAELAVRSRRELGSFMMSLHPHGMGVVLGVGRGEMAERLLNDWKTSPGLYLVDPYIHIWRGYDDPANLSDKEHQLIYEDVRTRLRNHEGRHVFVRDFSHAFADTYRSQPNAPPAAFVYVDANHAYESVKKDLENWWPILGQGGVMAGSTYVNRPEANISVKRAVDEFAATHGLQVFVTTDDSPPSWYMFKK